MNTISIPANRAYDAIIWASEHFGPSGYGVQNAFPAQRYVFSFENSEHASFFALRWQ
jgi:hypothetical protein